MLFHKKKKKSGIKDFTLCANAIHSATQSLELESERKVLQIRVKVHLILFYQVVSFRSLSTVLAQQRKEEQR